MPYFMRYSLDETIARACVAEVRFPNTADGIFVVTFPSLLEGQLWRINVCMWLPSIFNSSSLSTSTRLGLWCYLPAFAHELGAQFSQLCSSVSGHFPV